MRLLKRLDPFLLAVVAVGLVPFLWLSDGRTVKGVDTFFSLNPSGHLGGGVFAWDARTSTGQPAADLITLGINGYSAFLSWCGLSVALGQAIVLATLTLAAVLGMRALALRLLGNDWPGRPVAAVTAIAWVVNPFALSFVYWHLLLIEVTWAVLPWLLLLVFDYTSGRRGFAQSAALITLTATLGSAAFPHVYLPALGGVLLLFALGAAFMQGDLLPALRRGLAALVCFVAAQAWWLLPSLPQVAALQASAGIESSSTSQFEFASMYSHVPEVISLTGSPQLRQSTLGTPYITWSRLVEEGAGSFLKFVLPVLALTGAIVALRRRRSLGVVLTVGALLGVMLCKGDNPPFAGFNRFLVGLPMGEAFRHPLDKFSFLLVPCLILLFAFGLYGLLARRWGWIPGAVAAIVVVGYLGAPFYVGSVIPAGGETLPGARVTLPSSYPQVGQALARLPQGGKTQVFPYSMTGETAYDWPSGAQPNTDPILQDWAPDRSLLARDSGIRDADVVGNTLSEALAKGDKRELDYARIAGVDSVLVHRDWLSRYIKPVVEPAVLDLQLQRLTKRTALVGQLRTPELTLFRQPALPLVYAATDLVDIGPTPTTEKLLSAAASAAGDGAPALVDRASTGNVVVAPATHLDWTRSRTTAVHGHLVVSPGGGQSLVVFNQTYDKKWQLSARGGKVLRHVRVNGFANGWLVQSGDQFSWSIRYSPQRPYDIGLAVAPVQLFAAVGVLVTPGVRRRLRRRRAA